VILHVRTANQHTVKFVALCHKRLDAPGLCYVTTDVIII